MNQAIAMIPELNGVVEKLEKIVPKEPFDVVFYGSRSRGDFNPYSDYNFYILASPIDHLQGNFIQKVGEALDSIGESVSIHMVAGDYESFQYRMKLFDPTILHILEKGIQIFGKGKFGNICNNWQNYKNTHIVNTVKLSDYLEKRIRFYKTASIKSQKEDLSRLEKVLMLSIQLWIIRSVDGLSVEELVTLDMPDRIKPISEIMYKNELSTDIHGIIALFDQLRVLKKLLRSALPMMDPMKNSAVQNPNNQMALLSVPSETGP